MTLTLDCSDLASFPELSQRMLLRRTDAEHCAEFCRAKAKGILRSNGWTYREAAPLCGVCYQHLSEVLNGKRTSASLMRRIMNLAHNKSKQA